MSKIPPSRSSWKKIDPCLGEEGAPGHPRTYSGLILRLRHVAEFFCSLHITLFNCSFLENFDKIHGRGPVCAEDVSEDRAEDEDLIIGEARAEKNEGISTGTKHQFNQVNFLFVS